MRCPTSWLSPPSRGQSSCSRWGASDEGTSDTGPRTGEVGSVDLIYATTTLKLTGPIPSPLGVADPLVKTVARHAEPGSDFGYRASPLEALAWWTASSLNSGLYR